MPYDLALDGFALFFVLGAIATASSFILGSLRRLRPYAWRAWLWGTIGFLAMNAVLLGVIAYPLMHVGIASNSDRQTEFLGMLLGVAVVYGPTAASALGIVIGILAGCCLGKRKVTVSAIA
jgi:hypothetical protein